MVMMKGASMAQRACRSGGDGVCGIEPEWGQMNDDLDLLASRHASEVSACVSRTLRSHALVL